MAHIKCRYEELYCGVLDFRIGGKLCCPTNDDRCAEGCSNIDYDEWNIPCCEHSYLVNCEFEKTVKSYEFSAETAGVNNHYPVLTIGVKEYSRIDYLEIDGRVLVDTTPTEKQAEGKDD